GMAGIKNTAPNTTPNPAAIEMLQARISSGVWNEGPRNISAQTSPEVASQLNRRCSPIASTTISTNARPIDRHRIERIAGDRICDSALTAASSIAFSSASTVREVDTAGEFDKSLDGRRYVSVWWRGGVFCGLASARLDNATYVAGSGASSSVASGASGGETASGNTPNWPATSW